MIEQQGQVVAVSGVLASVRLGGSAGCTACDAGQGCGAGIFGRLLRRKPAILELENPIDARVGQAVVVGLPESVFLRLVFRFYLLPLLAGLAGIVFGHYLSVQNKAGPVLTDGSALLGGIVAAAVALVWNRKWNREFPQQNAVHLLRGVERAKADHCVGKTPDRTANQS
jgi:sigma-E factor negative regulatory protein RseC